MEKMNRHNICFPDSEWNIIKDYSKKKGYDSVSAFVRQATLGLMKKSEDMDLLEYIDNNCAYASAEEEKETMEFLASFEKNEDDFVEVTLNDILQD